MAVDLQRSFKTLFLPILLLLLVYLFHVPLSRELQKLGLLYSSLPYVLFTLGMIFSLLFRNSREFFNLVILTLAYLALNRYVWYSQTGSYSTGLLFYLICLLVPVNLVISDLLRERGILNRYGLQRLLIIAVQLGLILWAIIVNPAWLHHVMTIAPKAVISIDSTIIPPLALLLMLLCGISLMIYVFTHPSILQGALLIAFLSLLLGLHFGEAPALSRPYFMLAGLITIIALVQNSHLLAYRDELTQLPSRRALRQQLMELGTQYSIAMVDVDHFKKLNDTYGHDIGDQVLRMLASRLRKVNGGGRAYRYGGEEFTVIFPGKLRDEAQPFMQQLLETVASTPFKVRQKPRPKNRPESPKAKPDTRSLKVTVSIGVADSSQAESHSAVMKLADRSLYRAKKNGRNRIIT